jgi:hypothetical protein
MLPREAYWCIVMQTAQARRQWRRKTGRAPWGQASRARPKAPDQVVVKKGVFT